MPDYTLAHRDRHQRTKFAANRVLDLCLEAMLCRPGGGDVERVLDVGCGVGTWLRDFIERGVADAGLLGLDFHNFDKQPMVIPRECYEQHDLSTPRMPFALGKFDLAICLEFAEHIEAKQARLLVSQLTDAAPYVLFSAAVPGQGGLNHVNEQWQSYWRDLFCKFDFVQYDIIRAVIWDCKAIPFWYRQNTFLYAHHEAHINLPPPEILGRQMPLDVVHPELFGMKR